MDKFQYIVTDIDWGTPGLLSRTQIVTVSGYSPDQTEAIRAKLREHAHSKGFNAEPTSFAFQAVDERTGVRPAKAFVVRYVSKPDAKGAKWERTILVFASSSTHAGDWVQANVNDVERVTSVRGPVPMFVAH